MACASYGRPRHPQTQGKEERFHRTFKAEAVSGRSFRDLSDCQRAFDDWRQLYNHERPHEALGMATPAQRYRPSSRPFPEVLPPVEYGVDDQVRKVGSDGFISFKNRYWRIGKGLQGEWVALRPTGQDGAFAVYFCAHRVGAIDFTEADDQACGLVDNAAHRPQGPQEKQHQQTASM